MLPYYQWFPAVQDSTLERSLSEWQLHYGQAVIQIGIVVGTSQQHQIHYVRTSGALQLQCPSVVDNYGAIYGHRRSGLYSIGTAVLVMRTGEINSNAGIILGALPENGSVANSTGFVLYTGADELAGGSPAGTEKDPINARMIDAARTQSWNASRPIDAYPGDFVSLSDFGVGFWSGPLVSVMRAGHDCAVECHYVDNLLRLSGYNFQHWTAGSEQYSLDDYGEFCNVYRMTPFTWEALGAIYATDTISREGDSRESNTQRCGAVEPIENDPAGRWRLQRIQGLLGDLETTYVSVPSYVGSTLPRKLGEEEQVQDEFGVFRQRIGIDGAYSLTSAKSIAFIKEALIPIPREVYPPDDPRGDSSGILVIDGALDWERLRKMDVQFEDFTANESSTVKHASAVFAVNTEDVLTHANNYAANRVVTLHLYDWYLPEIQDLILGEQINTSLRGPTEAITGNEKYWASLPNLANIQVDPRTPDGRYFVSRALFVIHEDGAIHIEDGYGSQISMRGGNIDISAPGDITVRPGKDFVVLSGKDANVVAGVNVEISSQAGDTKIGANRNIEIMGGNDHEGGVLIESKAVGSLSNDTDYPTELNAPPTTGNAIRGIWLKCPESTISLYSVETIVTAGEDNGQILLDAGAQGSLITIGNTAVFNTETIALWPNDPQGTNAEICRMVMNPTHLAFFSPQMSILSDNLTIAGYEGQTNRVTLNGSLSVLGNVGSTVASGTMGYISDAAVDNARAVLETLVTTNNDSAEVIDNQLQSINDSLLDSIYRSGNTLSYLTFHYLSSADRRVPLEIIVVPESAWQKRFREMEVGTTIMEYPVTVGSTDTLPWPGAEARQAVAYGVQTSTFIDKTTTKPLNRGQSNGISSYDYPIMAMKGRTFKDNYRVNERNRTPETRLLQSEGE